MLRREALPLLALGAAVAFGTRAAWIDPVAAFPQRDTAFGELAIHHLQNALLGRAAWADAPLGWPLPAGTARLDWMLGQAVVTLPLRALGASPAAAHGVVSALGLLVAAVAVYGLARRLGTTRSGALLAGLTAGIGPASLAELHHANLTWGGLGVVAVLILVARQGVGIAGGATAGAIVVGAAHFGLYAGLFAGATFLAGLPAALALAGRRAWLGFAAGAFVAALSLVPVASLYAGAASAVDPGDNAGESWDPAQTLTPSPSAPLHRFFGIADPPPKRGPAHRSVNPGYLLGGMALLGGALALGRRKSAWALVLAAGVLAAVLATGVRPMIGGRSLGVAGPYAWVDFLTEHRLRAPERWLFLAQIALGLLAGLALSQGQAWVASRAGAVRASIGAALATALVFLELPVMAPAKAATAAFPPPAYALLEGAPPGPLFEVLGGRDPCRGIDRLRMQPLHGHPLVGGHQGRFSAAGQALNRTLDAWPHPSTLAWLREAGVSLVLEHPPLRPLPDDPGLRCTASHGHRLCVL